MIRWTRSIVVAACALLAALPALGQISYAQKINKVNVGTLVIPSQTVSGFPANGAPSVWSHLQTDQSVRPGNVVFVNPHGPSVLSTSARQRWAALAPDTPAAGAKLNKVAAAYWEVDLDNLSQSTLSDYDILLLPISGYFSLTPAQREKLRLFVDQGGTLWVDVQPTSSSDTINTGPLPFEISTGAVQTNLLVPHRILEYPYEAFPVPSPSNITIAMPVVPSGNPFDDSQNTLFGDSARLMPVLGFNATQPSVSVGQIGEGYVVVTSRWVTWALDRSMSNTGQVISGPRFFAQKPVLDGAFNTNAKFALNVVYLNSPYFGPGRGSRKQSASPVTVTAPLLRRFESPIVPTPGTDVVQIQGRVVMNSGGTLVCIDANPGRDLDGDGNADDGVPETSLGSNTDTVWYTDGGFQGSPVAADIPTGINFGGHTVFQVILIRTANGGIAAFDLLPPNPTSNNAIYTINPPGGASTGPKFSPTVQDGLAFVTDADNNGKGRVWAIDVASGSDLANGTRKFAVENGNRLGVPAFQPTVGYIPIQDNSGGIDRVVYCATQRDTVRNRPAGLISVWLGARGEVPQRLEISGAGINIYTRASLQGLPIHNAIPRSLGVRITIIDTTTGLALNDAQAQGVINGSPTINVGINGLIHLDVNNTANFFDQGGNPARYSLRVDYTVDWSAPKTGGNGSADSDQFVRGDLYFPDQAIPKRDIAGPIALSGNGCLFVGTNNSTANQRGASFFALREVGRGDFRMMYRWEFYDDQKLTSNQGAGSSLTFNYGPTLSDYDGLLDIIPFLDTPLRQWNLVGGATIRGDTVYVMAEGRKSIFGQAVPMGVLLALDGNPQAPEFHLDNVTANFSIVQPDPARSDTLNSVFSFLQPGAYTYESDVSVVDGTNLRTGKVRLNSVMQNTRGQVANAIISNLPVIIRQPSQAELMVEPESGDPSGRMVAGRAGGKWNPLKWYTVFNALMPTRSPVITGSNAYLAGTSILPGLVNAMVFNQPRGLITAWNVEVASSDLKSPGTRRPWMSQGVYSSAPVDPRPWQKFVYQITGTMSDIKLSPYALWPQWQGVASFDDFLIRLNQATLDDNSLNGMAVGDSTLSAWGNREFYGFNRADFLVVDEGRISRIDAAGNPLWSTDLVRSDGGSNVNASSGLKIQSPWRVYHVTDTSFIAADPGADRVFRFDTTGRETRSITDLRIDNKYIPDGWVNGEATSLNQPMDVSTFLTRVPAAANPYTNPQPEEIWRHYLIADSGNRRVIELVDRFDTNGNVVTYSDPNVSANPIQGLGVLYWHTKSEYSGRNYAYNTIGRTQISVNGNPKTVYAFGFGNVEPGKRAVNLDGSNSNELDSKSGYGGILLFDPSGRAQTLITSFQVPAIAANILYNPTTSNFVSPAVPARPAKKFAGLSSVTLRYVNSGGSPVLTMMVTDNTGVYELVESTPGNWSCRWMLPTEAYLGMRRSMTDVVTGENPLGFIPRYARRLDNGDVLITNGYFGRKRSGAAIGGEVIVLNGELDPTGPSSDPGYSITKLNLGFRTLGIRLTLPPVEGFRPITSPVFADRD
ncbi:MAG: hypothetical protein JST40_12545 [Armatimonadetes bacterium]|nr:hypothetical protein [Armatimonadota bacterium]